MSSLKLLLETVPNWFSVTKRLAHSVEGECLVIDNAAIADVTYAITVEEIGGAVYPRETAPGTLLPAACFNRHIMSEGHFCLGLGYGTIVRDRDTARLWWESLSEFLRIQGVAASSRRWPRHIELDHGRAGEYHRRALESAGKLGCSEEYELALLGQPSWITNPGHHLTADGRRLVNGRSPCPRGCRKNGRPVLRSGCCDPDAVAGLIRNERLRQAALEEFWKAVRNDETAVCCGTMISCPLRRIEENNGAQ